MHHRDTPPALGEAVQRAQDRGLRDRVHGGQRLVHEEQLGLLRERARQEDALLLPAGEAADGAVGQRLHAHLNERRRRRIALGARHAPPRAHAAVTGHADDIQRARRKVPIHRRALWQVGDARPRLREGSREEARLAGRDLDEAQRGLQQRGLARAVRPEDRRQPRRERPCHVIQHTPLAIAHAQPGDVEKTGHSRPFSPRGGASPPSARAMAVMLWSSMPSSVPR